MKIYDNIILQVHGNGMVEIVSPLPLSFRMSKEFAEDKFNEFDKILKHKYKKAYFEYETDCYLIARKEFVWLFRLWNWYKSRRWFIERWLYRHKLIYIKPGYEYSTWQFNWTRKKNE